MNNVSEYELHMNRTRNKPEPLSHHYPVILGLNAQEKTVFLKEANC